jgi:hypothetical protein
VERSRVLISNSVFLSRSEIQAAREESRIFSYRLQTGSLSVMDGRVGGTGRQWQSVGLDGGREEGEEGEDLRWTGVTFTSDPC